MKILSVDKIYKFKRATLKVETAIFEGLGGYSSSFRVLTLTTIEPIYSRTLIIREILTHRSFDLYKNETITFLKYRIRDKLKGTDLI